MLIFGHGGITLGTAVLLSDVLTKSYSLPRQGKADDHLEPGTGYQTSEVDQALTVSVGGSHASCPLLVAHTLLSNNGLKMLEWWFRASLYPE